MKNQIYIDVDTERAQPIVIGKGENITPPTTPEEALEMIKLDVSCMCEAMCTLVHVADQGGYGTKEQYVTGIIARLNEFLTEVQTPAPAPQDEEQIAKPNNTENPETPQ